MKPEIKINGQFPDGLRITIEKMEVLVDNNKQVSLFLDLFDKFQLEIDKKINKPFQEELANMLREKNSFPMLDGQKLSDAIDNTTFKKVKLTTKVIKK